MRAVLALTLAIGGMTGCLPEMPLDQPDLPDIQLAVSAWDAPLTDAGCEPFTLEVQVVIVPPDEWTGGAHVIGYWTGSKVMILDRSPKSFVPVLVHEFGHVIGLGHDDTPGSVMNPTVMADATSPSEHDIELACLALGV